MSWVLTSKRAHESGNWSCSRFWSAESGGDIISELFLIFENRIRVGDVAIINGTGGAVVQVNLRTTVLRSVDGTFYQFAINMTHEFSFYVLRSVSVIMKTSIE